MGKAYYLHVRPEIIEDTNEIAIKIGGQKLAQLPRFVLGFGNDLRVRGVPLFEEFVYFSLALEIEPEKDRDRKSTRLNSSHEWISYAVFCLKKKTKQY